MDCVRSLRYAHRWLYALKRRAEILGGLLKERTPTHVTPLCVMDVYTRDDFRAILERPLGPNGEDDVQADDFVISLADFNNVGYWAMTERGMSLVAALEAAATPKTKFAFEDLERPTSLFRCGNPRCPAHQQVLNSAVALSHRCPDHSPPTAGMWQRFGSYMYPRLCDLQLTDPMERMRMICNWEVGTCGGAAAFIVHADAVIRTRFAMESVGLDPDTGTVLELNFWDPWFVCTCVRCRGGSDSPTYVAETILDWRHMVSYGPCS
jgi:hypothetical protein